jgi:hypothetical protein
LLGRITQYVPNAGNGVVKAMVEVNKGIGLPEPVPKFLAGHEVAGGLQQDRQHLYGLALETQLDTALAQFASVRVEFKSVEAEDARLGRSRCGHRRDNPNGAFVDWNTKVTCEGQ